MNTTHKFIVLLLTALLLASCGNKGKETPASTPNITQAYQTVEAYLTAAVITEAYKSPTPTATLHPGESRTPRPTAGPNQGIPTATYDPKLGCDQARPGNPIDVTIPDDTVMEPGERFTKVWRLVNYGSCTWSSYYSVVWFSGDKLDAPAIIPLKEQVPPGGSIDISIDMVAPSEPGSYQSNWKLRNAAGEFFGIGPMSGAAFWVRIEVVQIHTPTPTLTPSPTPEPAVYTTGTVVMAIDDILDLDTGALNSPDQELLYAIVGDLTTPQLIPEGNAEFTVMETAPTLNQCQQAALLNRNIPIADLLPGTYFCYRTNLGLYGWLLYEHINITDLSITLTYATWSAP